MRRWKVMCGCCGGEDEEETRTVQEVTMVPCKYCNTLFAQTASFCPYCGARRIAQ
jgi:rubrerythrin